MQQNHTYVCSMCGYVYEDETSFADLPDNWVCPICGESKAVFT